MYFLRTPRLGFRSWTEDDLPLAMGLWADPEVTRFIDARDRLSEQDVRGLLERQLAFEREHGIQYWPIFLLATGARLSMSDRSICCRSATCRALSVVGLDGSTIIRAAMLGRRFRTAVGASGSSSTA